MDIVAKLIENHELSREEYIELLTDWENPEVSQVLTEAAVRLRKQYYGDKVYTRGLIEKMTAITAAFAGETAMPKDIG